MCNFCLTRFCSTCQLMSAEVSLEISLKVSLNFIKQRWRNALFQICMNSFKIDSLPDNQPNSLDFECISWRSIPYFRGRQLLSTQNEKECGSICHAPSFNVSTIFLTRCLKNSPALRIHIYVLNYCTCCIWHPLFT